MNTAKRLSLSLLGLRLTVFLVMLMWTVDKFIRPEHAAGVFANFYALGGFGVPVLMILGVLELLLLLAFVTGFARRFSYGAVLLLHAGSTLSAWHQYLHPHEGANLLFFTAWPMLAACFALYLLRDADSMTIDGRRASTRV
jgi:putative oxidoreductase